MKKTETCTYDSSMIESSTYDFVTRELIVIFTGGTQYSYAGVSEMAYETFSRDQESVGKAFNESVKRNYTGIKIITEDALNG